MTDLLNSQQVNLTEVMKHRIYLRESEYRIENGLSEQGEPLCSECGCSGNNSCGHECLDGDCALDMWLVCPCCSTGLTPATDKEVDAVKNQLRLF